jgi:phosphatidylserine decarboxylase
MIRMAPEGWPFVLGGLCLTVAAAALAFFGFSGSSGLQHLFLAVAFVFGILTLFTIYFFRNPKRQRRDGEGLVLAPADGRIVEIVKEEPGDLYLRPSTRISIFLSIFNVHIQRAPITGRVGLKLYKPGKYLAAWNPKASQDNEQSTLGLDAGPDRQIMVRQIAGLIARRIVTDPEKGDLVPQGSRIGLIRFGSRVDLFMPRDWEVTCRIGDKVKGGLSEMARVPDDGEGDPR